VNNNGIGLLTGLVALGFYALEAALLAVSRTEAFSLLRISQEFAASGQPANLLIIGKQEYFMAGRKR
jgi:hypothetical protein